MLRTKLHDFFNPFVKADDLILPEDETVWRALLEMAARSRQLPLLAERLQAYELPVFVRDQLNWAKSRAIAISAIHEELIQNLAHLRCGLYRSLT